LSPVTKTLSEPTARPLNAIVTGKFPWVSRCSSIDTHDAPGICLDDDDSPVLPDVYSFGPFESVGKNTHRCH